VHRCDANILKLSEEELRGFVLDCALVRETRVSTYDNRKPAKLLETAKKETRGKRAALTAATRDPRKSSQRTGA
jgi:hypothetical protein